MQYIKNLIVNGVPLGLFIYGVIVGIPWLVTTTVVLYWIMIVLSIAVMPRMEFRTIFAGDKGLREFASITSMVSKAFDNVYLNFNVIQDLIIAAIFSYFGFQILAIFYALHIFGYSMMYWNVKSFILNTFSSDGWSKVADNLQSALDADETKFNFYKLAGQVDPIEQEELLKDIK